MPNEDQRPCENCGATLRGRVCHDCGQRVITKRWSIKVLFNQFVAQLTNIERGFLYTTGQLFKAPGKLVTDYWKGRTIPYYNPFRYMIIWTTINLLLAFWLGIDEMIQSAVSAPDAQINVDPERFDEVTQQFNSWLNVLVLLIVPVKSVLTYLFFRNRKRNYAEHLIMNSFIYGQGAFISSVTQFVFVFIPYYFAIYFPFYFLVGLAYDSYVFQRTFKQPWWLIIVKALVIGAVGLATLFVLMEAFSRLLLFFI